MIDNASIFMSQGKNIATERIQSVDDNTMKSHFHDYYELYYLEKGIRHFIRGSDKFAMHPGEFIIIPPYTMHRSFSDPGVKFSRVLIYFYPAVLSDRNLEYEINNFLTPLKFNEQQDSEEFYLLVLKILDEQNTKNHYYLSRMQAFLNLALIKLIRSSSSWIDPSNDLKISNIINYLHYHYNEDLSLDLISEKFFISKFHFCREFKRFTHCSYTEYVNNMRILHAKRLFLESDETLTQISADVGFNSLTHFERVFKKVTGKTPKKIHMEYRDIYKSNPQNRGPLEPPA